MYYLQQRSVNASQCSRHAVRKLCHGVSQLLNCGTTWRLELGARVRLPLLKLNIFLNEMWFCFTIPTRVRKYGTYIMYRKRQIIQYPLSIIIFISGGRRYLNAVVGRNPLATTTTFSYWPNQKRNIFNLETVKIRDPVFFKYIYIFLRSIYSNVNKNK